MSVCVNDVAVPGKAVIRAVQGAGAGASRWELGNGDGRWELNREKGCEAAD